MFAANTTGTSLRAWGEYQTPFDPANPADDRPRIKAVVSASVLREYAIVHNGVGEHSAAFPAVTVTTASIQLVNPQ